METYGRFEQLLTLLSLRPDHLDPCLVRNLRVLYGALSRPEHRAEEIRQSVRSLLRHLATPHGGTPENRQVVADFLLAENDWETEWPYLPERLAEVLFELCRSDAGGPRRKSPRGLLRRLRQRPWPARPPGP